MRLLQRHDNGSLTLTKDLPNAEIPPYTILSHTWGDDGEEVVFQEIVEGARATKHNYRQKPGYRKIDFCAKQAAVDHLQYFWVDSCCIDKTSSAELSKAIISMFRWYQNAVKYYVYLSDIRSKKQQKLLAPRCVEFFSNDGCKLGDRIGFNQLLQEITGIATNALRIFDISINIRYSNGEERTISRLRAKIKKRWNSQRNDEFGHDADDLHCFKCGKHGHYADDLHCYKYQFLLIPSIPYNIKINWYRR
ncbi:HET-domain-containing protein [Xylariaceae sp. FL0255]|nr:HET-domain-containing protein [Xylariaceae sp. FL0255]